MQRSAETRLQACLLGLLVTAQRLLRWVQLAAMALTLQRSTEAAQQQQQMQLAYAGAAAGGSAGPAATPSSGDGSPSPASGSAAPEASSMIGFIGGAATGAVEQLRYTLNDAGAGMGEKMAALERTASSLQSSLFRAAQEHSANVRSNPSGGMWKQPSVDAVISEEERLRAAVFAQVRQGASPGGEGGQGRCPGRAVVVQAAACCAARVLHASTALSGGAITPCPKPATIQTCTWQLWHNNC